MNLKNKKLIFITLGLLATIIISIFVYNLVFFRVTLTVPTNNSVVSNGSNLVTINFNMKLLKENNDLIISADSDIIRNYYSDGNKINIDLKNTKNNQSYIILIKNIKAENGKKIDLYKYQFKTGYVPQNALSENEKKQLQSETDKGNIDNPILDVLPYNTPTISMSTFYGVNGKLKIRCEIYLTQADVNGGDENQSIEAYKKQANEYLISKGINPNDYQFDYVIN